MRNRLSISNQKQGLTETVANTYFRGATRKIFFKKLKFKINFTYAFHVSLNLSLCVAYAGQCSKIWSRNEYFQTNLESEYFLSRDILRVAYNYCWSNDWKSLAVGTVKDVLVIKFRSWNEISETLAGKKSMVTLSLSSSWLTHSCSLSYLAD